MIPFRKSSRFMQRLPQTAESTVWGSLDVKSSLVQAHLQGFLENVI